MLDEAEETLCLTEEFQLIIVKLVRETEKSLLEHLSNNCCRQDLSMHVKITRQKFREKQDIYIVSTYLFPNIY